MSQNVSVDQLAAAIEKELNDYKELASDELKKAVKKAGRAILEALQTGARVRLFGFTWNLAQASEISDMFDIDVV